MKETILVVALFLGLMAGDFYWIFWLAYHTPWYGHWWFVPTMMLTNPIALVIYLAIFSDAIDL